MKTFVEHMTASMNQVNEDSGMVSTPALTSTYGHPGDLNSEHIDALNVALNLVVGAADVVQMAHWNLRSSNFVALHPWLGDKYSELFKIADGIAEQIKIYDIDNMVTIKRREVAAITDEQILLHYVRISFTAAVAGIKEAAEHPGTNAPTRNLLEGWQGEIEKMRWFVTASLGS